MKLEKSKNYNAFRSNPHQRIVNESHVKKLAKDIKENGFIPSRPIQVYRNGSGFVVVDGHHRLKAAQSVGAEFFYVVESKECQDRMAGENRLVLKWGVAEYVRLYASQGNPDYMEILKYVACGIPMTQAISLLFDNNPSGGSTNAAAKIMDGTFKIKTRVTADAIVSIIKRFKATVPAVTSRQFIGALSRCLYTEGFVLDIFNRKLTENPTMIEKTSDVDQMLLQFEGLYNFRSRATFPLRWAVGETMKKRNFKKAK